MSATSIRNMHTTIVAREQAAEAVLAASAQGQPAAAEKLHYYRIERRVVKTTKKGVKEDWKFVKDLTTTPTKAQAVMDQHYAGPDYRLVDLLTY